MSQLLRARRCHLGVSAQPHENPDARPNITSIGDARREAAVTG
jgi:hypothetical protein